jgi:hypothetical protein
MDSINALNYSGIQSAESISDSAKQNLLLAQQLANQKKSELNEPLNMLGAELLTGGISDSIKNLGKSVAKKTGVKSFEKLGTEDLATTLRNAGREIGQKAIKKGGRIIADKLGSNVDDFLSRGKKFAVDKINNELKRRGVDVQINEDDLDNIENFKNVIRQKVNDAQQKLKNVTDNLSEVGENLKNDAQQKLKNVTDNLSEVGENLKNDALAKGLDLKQNIEGTAESIEDKVNNKFGKATQSVKEKIQNDIREKQNKLQSTKDRVEKQARGRDVGEGLDEEDKTTQSILGDLQEGKAQSLLKQAATKNYRFADSNIENVQNTIDDLPEFSKKAKAPLKETGTPEDLDEAREISLFDASNKPFKTNFQNNIEHEATLDDQDDIENTYVSNAQKAIQQAEVEANPVQSFINDTPSMFQPKVTETQYLDQFQLPSVTELTETADQKILRLQKERVDRTISDKASEDLGKKPSDLFADDPGIKDPTTLSEADTASLGRTTAKVPAQVEKKVLDTDLFADDDEPFTLDRADSDFVGQDKVDELAKGVDDRLSTLIGKDNDIGIRAAQDIGKVKKTSDFYNNENKNPAYDPKELEDEYNKKNEILDKAEAEQKLNEPSQGDGGKSAPQGESEPKINPNLEKEIDDLPEQAEDLLTEATKVTKLPTPAIPVDAEGKELKQTIKKSVLDDDLNPVSTLVDDDDLIRPATAADDALTGWRSQVANAQRVTPQTVNDPEVQALKKEAPEVEQSEKDAAKALKPPPTGLDEDVEDLGKADLAEGGEDPLGDIIEGVLGIAALTIPSELEGHGDLNNHNAIFSSSFQAGVTG